MKAHVEEVLQEEPQRLRVRWDDGHETILSPAAGAARVEQQQKTKTTKTKATTKTKPTTKRKTKTA